MKVYKLPKLNIPNSWGSVEDFCEWYLDNNLPIYYDRTPEVFKSDDATSFCMFKKGQYQVEMYLIHPVPNVTTHEHPDVQVIKVRINSAMQEQMSCEVSETLQNGTAHGNGFIPEAAAIGFPLLAVQKWKEGVEPTTVAAQWRGKTVGPMQENLIRRFHPGALVIDGYADITKKMSYLQELKNVANG
jgi:hypothetical protein